ncbi:aminoacyl-tRNA hydrolase [Arachidicoccus terrestris]|uniref:aminoacyl-tRNA hydrolase n=1 Tax=Arachidicoccus terrestris TaxID=2875539 RepID=UPI001CC5FED6|nr:aminoacyl-tRNA hydrolase [Arachidicoccus terrestris]UAY54416.1 aminoacyl-tRNA hydrolase [Arachidicoccus terrestris]
MSKFLIVGLGNPGSEYAGSRHNAGFDVVDAFVSKHEGSFRSDRLADVAEVRWKGKIFICIKPTTFMNLSGKAFRYWMDKEKVPLERTLTVVDDLALPIDKVRIRAGGSDAGHNGLRDIQQILGTTEYPKLRFGIGNQFPKGMQVDFVLGKWFPEERETIRAKVDKCVEMIEQFAVAGISRVMNDYNKQSFSVVKK